MIPSHQSNELTKLVGLRLALPTLYIDLLDNPSSSINMMTPDYPHFFKLQCQEKIHHIRKVDIRHGTAQWALEKF